MRVETNEQMAFWKGQFGDAYVDRNAGDWDEFYRRTWGVSRTELNEEFLNGIPKDARILEVGCNVGKQLQVLKRQGFTDLWGIEINRKALGIARKDVSLNLVEASGFDIPFKDGFFDVVFTSGVLIHIAPEDLPLFMAEMARVSRRYVWGFEYHAKACTPIEYRGHENRLWKNDFPALFIKSVPGLSLVRLKNVPYVNDSNVDAMFLLEKRK